MVVTRLRWAPVLASLIIAAVTPGSKKVYAVSAPGGPERPRILGISHVALRVSDPTRSRVFYERFLGCPTVQAASGLEPTTLRVAVGERQYVELRAGLRPDEDRLDHVALETDDVEAMRRFLGARGVDVPGVVVEASGSRCLMVKDPEGRSIEFVQPAPEAGPRSALSRPAGVPGPVAHRLRHAGILAGDLSAADHFYHDVLGLTETWRGSRSGTELSWVNLRVPDGQDYIELMLYGALPPPTARGSQHHICLEVSDIEEARVRLLERRDVGAYAGPLEIRVGTNRKRQLNLFDPDGTRIELMEPGTVDGQSVPSSTAPPPHPTGLGS
ncbi:MAG TPA: VOC family protein [Vicinamibacteria bacterium]|jgi:catechol 2,3-dioxygenase-like lactoylglutathione lyase family enzyme|nr:VOC family protein [Vicinamibacteria bacterium]